MKIEVYVVVVCVPGCLVEDVYEVEEAEYVEVYAEKRGEEVVEWVKQNGKLLRREEV